MDQRRSFSKDAETVIRFAQKNGMAHHTPYFGVDLEDDNADYRYICKLEFIDGDGIIVYAVLYRDRFEACDIFNPENDSRILAFIELDLWDTYTDLQEKLDCDFCSLLTEGTSSNTDESSIRGLRGGPGHARTSHAFNAEPGSGNGEDADQST